MGLPCLCKKMSQFRIPTLGVGRILQKSYYSPKGIKHRRSFGKKTPKLGQHQRAVGENKMPLFKVRFL